MNTGRTSTGAINISSALTRNTGLMGLSPLRQTNQYSNDQQNKKAESKPWWKSAMDWGQNALDIVGFVPGIGVVADLANAGISVARGDYGRAALSAIAAVPGLDYAAAAGKGLSKLNRAKKLIPNSNPITAIANRPVASIAEGAMGIDYANSNLNPLADTDRESIMGKVGMAVGEQVGKDISSVKSWWKGDGGTSPNNDTSNNEVEETSDTPDSNEKPEVINKPNVNQKKLREIQESRGYYRDK
jgi:hypothetical protein